MSIDLITTASVLFASKPCAAQDPIVSEHVPSGVIWIPSGIIYDFQCDGFVIYLDFTYKLMSFMWFVMMTRIYPFLVHGHTNIKLSAYETGL